MIPLVRLLRLALLGPLTAACVFAQTPARTPPKPVNTPTPQYPAALVDTGRDGQAVIEFTVGTDGTVQNPTVKSADDPAFGEAALAVLPDWKFQPGTRDGQPSAMKVALPFKFEAPPDQRVNAVFGRKVFREVAETPIPASEFKGSVAPLNTPPTGYPASAAGSGQEVTAEVEFLVSPDGLAVNPTVVNEVPGEFGALAILHVARLVFEPPTKDGQPVYVQTRRNVRFEDPGPTLDAP